MLVTTGSCGQSSAFRVLIWPQETPIGIVTPHRGEIVPACAQKRGKERAVALRVPLSRVRFLRNSKAFSRVAN